MNTHETYVSLEVAQLLKQAGFDWKVSAHYSQATDEIFAVNPPPYPAPTLDVAQRWLREVKGYNLGVVYSSLYEKWYVSLPNSLGQETVTKNNTYESALEAGIKKVLELILEKGE